MNNIIKEIETNKNTGVEFEIALFYKIKECCNDNNLVQLESAIEKRNDSSKIFDIYERTDISDVLKQLRMKKLSLKDCTLETQNDNVGPSDIVLVTEDSNKEEKQIGLSVKFANRNINNPSSRHFLSQEQIEELKNLLPQYAGLFLEEVITKFGKVNGGWIKVKDKKLKRERYQSKSVQNYIDKIRQLVISNWTTLPNKKNLLCNLFQNMSPIDYWIFEYKSDYTHKLDTKPFIIKPSQIKQITLDKYKTSYIGFYLQDKMIAKMQVKFNNGILEVSKTDKYDIEEDGIGLKYGDPFGSWNFSCIK